MERKLTLDIKPDLAVSLVNLEGSVLVAQTRDAVCLQIAKNRHWPMRDRALQLRDLAFGGEVEEKRLRSFAILSSSQPGDLGYGAAQIDRSSGHEPFLEYCLTVLADGTSIEIWTLKEQKELTLCALNGQPFAHYKTAWSKFLWDSVRTRWDIFVRDDFWGSVETGDYLFVGRYLYCRHLVRWNSLKVVRPNKPPLPIYLTRYERISDFFNAVFRLATLEFLWGKRSHVLSSSLIIPQEAQEVNGGETLHMFVTNIAFRALFFDLAYIDRTGGAG